MIRVVLVEDSPTTREYLTSILDGDPELRLVGTARDGSEGVQQVLSLRPDVVRMDGYEATRQIMERAATPIVLISASFNAAEVAMTFQALEAGALTVVEKPAGPGDPLADESAQKRLQTLRLMAEVRVVHRWPRRNGSTGGATGPALTSGNDPTAVDGRSEQAHAILLPSRRTRLIAIGASPGGPNALSRILGALPSAFDIPIIVAQHITPGFVDGLADWLGQCTPMRVKIAESGEPLRGGTVYLAPADCHVGAGPGRIRLSNGPSDDGFYPSATELFRSAALAYGPSAVGVLLTGMGRDGAVGLLAMRRVGALTITQDRESCVVYGMPAEAVRLGAAQYVLSPEDISVLLGRVARQRPGYDAPVPPSDALERPGSRP